MTDYRPRSLGPLLREALADMPVVVVTGLRQTGKSALIETYVAQNLAGILETDWPEARLAYWHVQGRYEVDFVIEVGRESLAIEVKAAARWDERALTGLRAFLAKTPRCRAAILAYGGKDLVRLGERLWAIPLGTLLA